MNAEFTIQGQRFRTVDNFTGGVTLQQWSELTRGWTRVAAFASRAEARAEARRIQAAGSVNRGDLIYAIVLVAALIAALLN